jgi:transposase
MTKKKRPNYSPEFRLETAQLVVSNGYTHEDAAKAMGVDGILEKIYDDMDF